MFNPDGVPDFFPGTTPDVLAFTGAELTKVGAAIRSTGYDVNSSFEGLSGCYQAPEAQTLITSLRPAYILAYDFGSDIESMGTALEDFANEIKPPYDKLQRLLTKARGFIQKCKQAEANGDDWQGWDNWVQEENSYHEDTAILLQQMMNIQVEYANKIEGLVDGLGWWPDSYQRKERSKGGFGGYKKPPMVKDENPDPPPWGTPEVYDAPWIADVGNMALGIVDGLTTMLGIQWLIQSTGWEWDDKLVNGAFGHPPADMHKMFDAWADMGGDILMLANKIPGVGELLPEGMSEDLDARWDDTIDTIGDDWSSGNQTSSIMGVVGLIPIGPTKLAGAASKLGRLGSLAAKVPPIRVAAHAADKFLDFRDTLRLGAIEGGLKIPVVGDVLKGYSHIPVLGKSVRLDPGVPLTKPPKIDLPTGGHHPLDLPNIESPRPGGGHVDPIHDGGPVDPIESVAPSNVDHQTVPGRATSPDGTTTPSTTTPDGSTRPGDPITPGSTTPSSTTGRPTTTPGDPSTHQPTVDPQVIPPTQIIPNTPTGTPNTGSTVPGSTTPGSTTPGSTTPGSTVTPSSSVTPGSTTTPGTVGSHHPSSVDPTRRPDGYRPDPTRDPADRANPTTREPSDRRDPTTREPSERRDREEEEPTRNRRPGDPHTPDGTDPTSTRPGEHSPTHPGEHTPTRPTEHTRPGEHTPTRPTEHTSTRPGEHTPAPPTESTPTRPGEPGHHDDPDPVVAPPYVPTHVPAASHTPSTPGRRPESIADRLDPERVSGKRAEGDRVEGHRAEGDGLTRPEHPTRTRPPERPQEHTPRRTSEPTRPHEPAAHHDDHDSHEPTTRDHDSHEPTARDRHDHDANDHDGHDPDAHDRDGDGGGDRLEELYRNHAGEDDGVRRTPEDHGFASGDKRRTADPEVLEQAAREAEEFARKVPRGFHESVKLITQSSFKFVNKVLYGGHDLKDFQRVMETDGNSGLTPRTIRAAEELEQVVRSAPDAPNSRTVYRGVRMPEHLPHSELVTWARDAFKVGEELDFKAFQHTSLNPAVASDFAHQSNRTGVVLEVQTRKGAPVGKMSGLEDSEAELLQPRNRRYRVVGISENVSFDSRHLTSDGKPKEVRELVVHMLDVEDFPTTHTPHSTGGHHADPETTQRIPRETIDLQNFAPPNPSHRVHHTPDPDTTQRIPREHLADPETTQRIPREHVQQYDGQRGDQLRHEHSPDADRTQPISRETIRSADHGHHDGTPDSRPDPWSRRTDAPGNGPDSHDHTPDPTHHHDRDADRTQPVRHDPDADRTQPSRPGQRAGSEADTPGHGQPGHSGHPNRPGHSNQPNQPNQPGHSNQPNQPRQPIRDDEGGEDAWRRREAELYSNHPDRIDGSDPVPSKPTTSQSQTPDPHIIGTNRPNWKEMHDPSNVSWDVPQERGRPPRLRIRQGDDLFDRFGPKEHQAERELDLTAPPAYGEPGVPRGDRDARYNPGDPGGGKQRALEQAAGRHPLQTVQRWLRLLNPNYHRLHPNGNAMVEYQFNCSAVMRATVDLIQGRRVRLADGDFKKDPANTPVPGDYDDSYEWMGVRAPGYRLDRHLPPGHPDPAAHLQAFTDKAYAEVEAGLRGRPPGTVAAICVQWSPAGGHWFSAYVDPQGKIRALDPQDCANPIDVPWPHRYPSKLERLEYTIREPNGDWEGSAAEPESTW